jgi:hypothetical protein
MVHTDELLAGSEGRTCSYLLLTDTRTGSASQRYTALLGRQDCLAHVLNFTEARYDISL